jgi:hypothetical protein
MVAQSEEGRRIDAFLDRRIAGATDISVIGDAIVSLFQDLDGALVPIIGPKGVAALHRRSLLMSIAANPALAPCCTRLVLGMDLVEFKAILLTCEPAEAVVLGRTLLLTTYRLLCTLIGPSLCARLLYEVWDRSLSHSPDQESSS